MTSATDRPSIFSLLDQAESNTKDFKDYLQFVPRRAVSDESREPISKWAERDESNDVAVDPSHGVEHLIQNMDVKSSLTKKLQGSAVNQTDFELMTKSINAACAMLKDLGKRNEELTSSAEGTIASLKTQLAVEKERSNKLQRELDAVRAEKDRLADDSQTRITQLESLNASLTEKLEEAMRELESVRPWLEYLSSQIDTELHAAMSQAERVMSAPVSLAN